jgi:hypothetical protein
VEILSEIMRIVAENSDPEAVEILTSGPDPSDAPLVERLLHGVHAGSYRSDDDAAMDLYGTSANDQRFRTLKSRTLDRVIHGLLWLQIQPPKHSEYFTQYYRCIRNLVAAQALVRLRARQAGYNVAQRTIVIAERYEFTDIILPLALLLRDTAALWSRRSLFEAYHAKVRWAKDLLDAEQEADYEMDALRLHMRAHHCTIQEQAERHRVVAERIEALYKAHGSLALRVNAARSKILFLECVLDYDGVDMTCGEIILHLVDTRNSIHRARIAEFQIHRMASWVFRRRPIPQAIVDVALDHLIPGGHNWFVAMGMMFTDAMLEGRYERAERIYMEATGHARYRFVDDSHRERWLVFHAHLVLAELLGLFRPETSRVDGFRLSTFLNSVPNESRDKRNTNALILIFHCLYLELTNRREEAERRIEYLNVYATRYLREDAYARLWNMAKAMQYVPRYRSDRKALRTRVAPLIRKIREASHWPMPGEINELIRYEVLLDALIKRLSAQTRV